MTSSMSRKGRLLSYTDKKLLKLMLSPNGKISTNEMAKKLGIPVTTVRRHRSRLEKQFLRNDYSLDLGKFGWHRVIFLVATEHGKTDKIAADMIRIDEVVLVGKSIGQQNIDLHVESILRGNAEILHMLEILKRMQGVKDVVWSEVVKVTGRKNSIPSYVIDQL